LAATPAPGSVDGDPHVLRLLGAQGLSGQDVLDLRRADAVGQRAEGSVGRRMAVAADNGHARLGAALLGTHHMDNAISDVSHGEELDPVVLDVAFQGLELQTCFLISHGANAPGLALGGDVVVRHRQGPVRSPDGALFGRRPAKAWGW